MEVDQIVGSHEIAERLGLARSASVQLLLCRRFPDFPAPITQAGFRWLWAWPDIEAWAVRRDWPVNAW